MGMPAQHLSQAEMMQLQLEWQQEVHQRQQRILQAQQRRQQQHQTRQQQALQFQQEEKKNQAPSPPAINANTRAQQLVEERESKRRKLNDSYTQVTPQDQPSSPVLHEQATAQAPIPSSPPQQQSSELPSSSPNEFPARNPNIDWDQIFV